MNEFKGFNAGMIDFLYELRFINTTENLPDNKIKYMRLISEPLQLLYKDIQPIAPAISESIETRPSQCISSMYNDMRFSRGTPLKTYMYLRFRETGRDTDIPGLYFDMGAEGYSYGIRIYKQTSAGMAAMRKTVIDNQTVDLIKKSAEPDKQTAEPDKQTAEPDNQIFKYTKQVHFSELLSGIKKDGARIIGDSFKQDHFPDIADPEVKAFLNLKGFYICFDRPINRNVFSNKLAEEIMDGFVRLRDIYRFIIEV